MVLSILPRWPMSALSAQKIADAIWAVEHAGVYSAASVIEALRALRAKLEQAEAREQVTREALKIAIEPLEIAASYVDAQDVTVGIKLHARDCQRALEAIRKALPAAGAAAARKETT
jgi:hypothetical protein